MRYGLWWKSEVSALAREKVSLSMPIINYSAVSRVFAFQLSPARFKQEIAHRDESILYMNERHTTNQTQHANCLGLDIFWCMAGYEQVKGTYGWEVEVTCRKHACSSFAPK